MSDISWWSIAPELALLGGVVVLLLVEVFAAPRRVVWAGVAGLTLAAAFGLSIVQWVKAVEEVTDPTGNLVAGPSLGLHWSGMIVLDGFSAFAAVMLSLVAAVGLVIAWPLIERQGRKGAEFVSLLLVALAGAMVMASSAHLVMMFLGLEIASISFYVLAGFSRERPESDEAAVKYFLLGSFASAVFLYGVALAYAATGSLSLYAIRDFLQGTVVLDAGVLLAAVALLTVGLGFKVSAAPFHMWAPDVYQGAASGISGFLSAAAKVAGFAALARVLVVGFGIQRTDWAPALAGIAAFSIVLGTLFAIAQTDIKRMLAYSSIAHAGFILTALVAGADGIPAMWFYIVTYAFQVLFAFGVVAVVGGSAGARSALGDYAGLAARSPALAGLLTLMMLSMGGIPITAGFIGKVGVFGAAIDAGYLWLVVVGLVASAAGLFFYLRVVVLMYMQAPAPAEAPGAARAYPVVTRPVRIALTACAVVTLAFGVFPVPLLDAVRNALPF